MNDAANKHFDGFAADPTVAAPVATPCQRWEGGVQTRVRTGNCPPRGLVLTHTQWIQVVFGGRTQDALWPEEKK